METLIKARMAVAGGHCLQQLWDVVLAQVLCMLFYNLMVV